MMEKARTENLTIDRVHSARPDYSEAFVNALSATISSLGTSSFYPTLFEFVGQHLHCRRWLLVRYRRFAKPEFLYNTSLSSENQEDYLDGLYRLDPLLRLVTDGNPPSVLTFQDICRQQKGDEVYHDLYRRCLVRDELVIMLPDMGGAYLALCFDRQGHDFTTEEVRQTRRLFPIIAPLHRYHIERSLARDAEMIQGGGTIRMAVMDANGHILYKCRDWQFPEREEVDRIMEEVCRDNLSAPVQIGEHVLHWEPLAADHTIAPGGRVFLFENHSPGYVKGGIETAFTSYVQSNNLSPRERAVVELMMRGYPTIGIAEKLNLTMGTVKSYKHRLYEKLDITSEREVFAQFIQHLFHENEKE